MPQISLNRIVSVSLQAALAGLANANTSALALITNEVPIAGAAFGTYGIYYSPAAVAADWGSNSNAYAQAVAIFSQNPSILSAGGYLVIIPRLASAPASAATIVGSGPVDLTQLTGADYKINLAISGSPAADIDIGAIPTTGTLAQIQTAMNSAAITAAGVVFSLAGTPTSAVVTLKTIATGATTALTVGATVAAGLNIAPLVNLGVTPVIGSAAGAESIRDAILRTYPVVFFFGALVNVIPTDAELPAIAALFQAIDKMFFFVEITDAENTGIIQTLQASGFTNTRGLLRIDTLANGLLYAAAYASRGLSTDFTGQGTVSTMHLKNIIGLPADPGLTETYVSHAQASGADVYADFGVPKLFTSGANGYFDAVYIGLAFKLAIRVAVFNYLATTNTKIPQTESGMNGLKGTIRKVCKQFVANGAFAPGAWLESTFGDPADFIRNIAENGFYIYSLPIASQTLAARTARQAPLLQIACKSAGAIHSSNVLINIEA